MTGITSKLSKRKCSSKRSRKIRWQAGNVIGTGRFGYTVHAINIDTGTFLAVKQVNVKRDECEKDGTVCQTTSGGLSVGLFADQTMERIEREVSALKQLKHPGIVKYFGTERTGDTINILMEYCPAGSLHELVHTMGCFSERLTQHFLKQLLIAVDFIHEEGISHRDLKCSNILLSETGSIKLADFGSSKYCSLSGSERAKQCDGHEHQNLDDLRSAREGVGSVYWMSPELIHAQKGKDEWRKSDIWSLGCTVIEMVTGKPPWSETLNSLTVLYQVGSKNATPTLPKTSSKLLQDLLSLCFERDPAKRPSAKELMVHPFLQAPIELNTLQVKLPLEENVSDIHKADTTPAHRHEKSAALWQKRSVKQPISSMNAVRLVPPLQLESLRGISLETEPLRETKPLLSELGITSLAPTKARNEALRDSEGTSTQFWAKKSDKNILMARHEFDADLHRRAELTHSILERKGSISCREKLLEGRDSKVERSTAPVRRLENTSVSGSSESREPTESTVDHCSTNSASGVVYDAHSGWWCDPCTGLWHNLWHHSTQGNFPQGGESINEDGNLRISEYQESYEPVAPGVFISSATYAIAIKWVEGSRECLKHCQWPHNYMPFRNKSVEYEIQLFDSSRETSQAACDFQEEIRVRAVANYFPNEVTELCLRESDELIVLCQDSSGWWQGKKCAPQKYEFPSAGVATTQCEEDEEEIGWFPCTYVEFLEVQSTEREYYPQYNVQDSDRIVVRALDSYHAQEEEEELPFEEGSLITVLERHESGWWRGEMCSSGEVGWFPSTYVEYVCEETSSQAPFLVKMGQIDNDSATTVDLDSLLDFVNI